MSAIPFAAGFDTGLTTMGFTLLNPDGTEYAARSTVGVTEVGPGRYSTTVTVPDEDLPLVLQWDDGAGGEAAVTIPAPAAATEPGNLSSATIRVSGSNFTFDEATGINSYDETREVVDPDA